MPESKLTLEQVLAAIERFEPEELSLIEKQLKQHKSELHSLDIEGNPIEPSDCFVVASQARNDKATVPDISVPKDFPPKIQELLKKRGWNWPPDEKLKIQIREAGRRLSRSIHIEPDILEEVRKDDFPSRFPDNKIGKVETQNETENES